MGLQWPLADVQVGTVYRIPVKPSHRSDFIFRRMLPQRAIARIVFPTLSELRDHIPPESLLQGEFRFPTH